MAIDLAPLQSTRRLLIEAQLVPVQGKRFQPTGFPDLGPATYQAGETACLLVESAQSMANRLEATIWNESSNELVTEANGLSYVVVKDKEAKFLTSSIVEAHRLNSPYIEKCEGDFFKKELTEAIGIDKTRPVDRAKFLAALFRYDVNTLLHGVFLESLDGRLRIPRAVSAFIESEGIQSVASGGVKNDRVQATKDEGQTSSEGFGNVPFPREEFTAEKTLAFFSVDMHQIRSYGLGDDATEMLTVLALFKIRTFLDSDLRLRTACDFTLKDKKVTASKPQSCELPSRSDLVAKLELAIGACKKQMVVTPVNFMK